MSEPRDRRSLGSTLDIEGTDENDATVRETVNVPPGLYMRRRWRARLRALGWPRSLIRLEAQSARAARRRGWEWPGVYFAGTARSVGSFKSIHHILIPAAAWGSGSFTVGYSTRTGTSITVDGL